MLYQINGFVFNSDTLVLTQEAEPVELRHNEAKLLALLLENSDSVLTKETILSQVWQGKVVSDQAVFQNISHLRNIFGSSAIKTFSKRGYQWVLPYQLVTAESQVSNQSILVPEKAEKQTKQSTRLWLSIAAAFVILVTSFLILNHSEDHNKPPIAYIPISFDGAKQTLALPELENYDVTTLNKQSYQGFMTAMEVEFLSIKPNYPLVLTGKMYEDQQTFYLDFLVKGEAEEWHGFLSGSSPQHALNKLTKHLNHDVIRQFVSQKNTREINQASLSLAHEAAPNDFIILTKLIEAYRLIDENGRAMVMAEKLEQQARECSDWQYVGAALIEQMHISIDKKLFDLAEQKFELALSEFEKINDITRQADAWNVRSILALVESDYPMVKHSLLTSAELAQQANDIERELHALTYLSVLAHKKRQEEDKYLYLARAEEKMREYKLPIYRFAKIPFHHAIYAESKAAKEPHYKRVLEYAKLTPGHWIAESSRRGLVEFYIEQGRIDEARALVEDVSLDNAQSSYIKAVLAKALRDNDGFAIHAKRTFEQAQLIGDETLSLNIALLLCEQPDSPINYDYYSQYIHENAPDWWRKNNETKLMALNL